MINAAYIERNFKPRRTVPIYDMSKPEDVAKYLSTLDVMARPGKESPFKKTAVAMAAKKTPEFMAEVREHLKRIRGER